MDDAFIRYDRLTGGTTDGVHVRITADDGWTVSLRRVPSDVDRVATQRSDERYEASVTPERVGAWTRTLRDELTPESYVGPIDSSYHRATLEFDERRTVLDPDIPEPVERVVDDMIYAAEQGR